MRRRTGRILTAVVLLLSSLATLGADPAGAATTTPDFVLASTTVPRGGSTTFTSTFTMVEGTAQATLDNLGTELSPTFDAACTASSFTPGAGPFTCAVQPATGAITVVDGVSATDSNVNVTITGSITASHNFALSSTEGATGMSTAAVPDLTITLNQGGGAGNNRTSPPQTLTIGANPGTDAEVALATTAPGPAGVDAGRGTDVSFTADLTRTGVTAQQTSGTATLVPVGPQLGAPSVPVPVEWASGETTKTVAFTVAVPSDIPLGGAGSYRIELTYDPNSTGGSTLDTEVGATRSLTVTPGPNDAVVTLEITAPADGVEVPRGESVDYTATLTRTGNSDQETIVRLSLEATGDQRGTTPAAPVDVFFASGTTTVTRSLAVAVPAESTLGSVAYRFTGVYDPTGTGPAAEQVDSTLSQQRSFDIVAAAVTPSPTSDLSVSIGVSPTTGKARRDVTYTVTVVNHGPDAAGFRMTDQLPSTLTFQGITTGAAACTTPPVGSSGAIICESASLASGASAVVTFTARIGPVKKTTITNTATVEVTGSATDVVTANNTASILLKVK